MASCSCLMDDWEGEFVVVVDRICRSGIPGTCPGCETAIPKGETIRLVQGGGYDDGCTISSTYRYHPECLALLMGAANKYGTGWVYGCSFADCIDGWVNDLDLAKEEDKQILELADKVLARMNT